MEIALYRDFDRGLVMDEEDIEIGIADPLRKSFRNCQHNSWAPKEVTTFETVTSALEEFVLPMFVLLWHNSSCKNEVINYANEIILIVQYWASILHIVCVVS
jgi:hypothetical protein